MVKIKQLLKSGKVSAIKLKQNLFTDNHGREVNLENKNLVLQIVMRLQQDTDWIDM